MKLPRRVPWKTITDLDQVCSWIYTDNDINAKEMAVNRLAAWKSITPLPHALESTLLILSVTLLDLSPSQKPSATLHLRQSYATAIIRLVNGLVDPLQVGAYARSIAVIAAQLGLPPWLVELRHAATHEELPSLELLREAARESLSWLLHHYFLPTLSPSISTINTVPLRPLTPLLKRYKTLQKTTVRDASLRTQQKPNVDACLRDIERWIAEAKVAAGTTANGLDWDGYSGVGDNDEDTVERWALDRLTDALLEKGALVPLSKKKRVVLGDKFLPPKESVLLWMPFLSHLQTHHPGFPSILAHRILYHLSSDQPSTEQTSDIIHLDANEPRSSLADLSYDMCLGRWIIWILNTCNTDSDDGNFDLKKSIFIRLAAALGPCNSERLATKKVLFGPLLNAVSEGNLELEKASALLLSATSDVKCQQWHQDDLVEMDKRLHLLVSCNPVGEEPSNIPEASAFTERYEAPYEKNLPLGWKLLSTSSSWKGCPIGLYNSGES